MNEANEEAGMSGKRRRGELPPGVEDNGPWWVVFIVTFIILFGSAFAALVHSLTVTFP